MQYCWLSVKTSKEQSHNERNKYFQTLDRLENSIQSESNLEQNENRMTAPQGSQPTFLEKLLSSTQAEMYNHSKVFYKIYRLIEFQVERVPGDIEV